MGLLYSRLKQHDIALFTQIKMDQEYRSYPLTWSPPTTPEKPVLSAHITSSKPQALPHSSEITIQTEQALTNYIEKDDADAIVKQRFVTRSKQNKSPERVKEYLIKWHGWDASWNTWESADRILQESPEAVSEYEAARAKTAQFKAYGRKRKAAERAHYEILKRKQQLFEQRDRCIVFGKFETVL